MVNLYTAAKRRRRADSFSPGGKTGRRSCRASIVVYKQDSGGLRRRARDHRRDRGQPAAVLPITTTGRTPSGKASSRTAAADLLVYGMGENPLLEIADALASGIKAADITYIKGNMLSRKKTWTRCTGMCKRLPWPRYRKTSANTAALLLRSRTSGSLPSYRCSGIFMWCRTRPPSR